MTTPTDLLTWKPESNTAWVAMIGIPGDGVRFYLTLHPTCYRRGPWRLLVDVLGGERHHDWGCFDEADQPLRNYHDPERAKAEAEAIAKVLMADRLGHGPIGAERVNPREDIKVDYGDW